MKIIEYKTAAAGDYAALDKEVNKLLGQGYQLYGNPYFGDGQIVAQAMVKGGMHESPPPLETIAETTIAP